MTELKTLSPQEALRALADGRKLSFSGWDASQYVYLNKYGELVDEQNKEWKAHEFSDFYEYTEPKPKRKLAPYYVEYSNGGITLEDKCFETDEQARKYFDAVSVTRCMVLEGEF